MKICELYAGIQGESTFAGLPCVFVRVSGCNLRCSYCDTSYSYYEGKEMSIEEILLRVENFGIKLVEITGGEPLLQSETTDLISCLVEKAYEVLIETNGSIDISSIDERAIVIMDIKTPGSGESANFRFENLDLLKPKDELKFVLTGRADYEWAVDFIKKHRLEDRLKILFSPVFNRLDPECLAGWIVGDRLKVRLNIQLHKYIYGHERRGV